MKLITPNLIKVESSNQIDINLVKIVLKNELIKNETVYYYNKSYWLPHSYGFDVFTVYYDNNLIGKAHIFNTNNWHNHIYNFKITKKNNKIEVDFLATGPDGPRGFSYKEDFAQPGG